MTLLALRMLFNDKAKFFGILMGVMLASLVITQQGSIFVGIMARAASSIQDINQPDLWVMDPLVDYIDDNKPMQTTQLNRIKGVEGVEWAMPLYKNNIKARLNSGQIQTCIMYGLDDSSLIGLPRKLVEGNVDDIRRADAIIVDRFSAEQRLARTNPDGTTRPLHVGDILELNDHYSIVVGIADITRTFQNQPIIYTTLSRALQYAPPERRVMTYIVAKVKYGESIREVGDRIAARTGLKAYTASQFAWATVDYFLKYTGIPINFGIAVGLGFLVGTLITGFMFYNFTLDNLRYFATFKAMGAGDALLVWLIMLQALTTGVLGYGLGVGLTAMFGNSVKNAPIAFMLTWQLLVIAFCAVIIICMLASLLSSRKVIKLEPGVVFKG